VLTPRHVRKTLRGKPEHTTLKSHLLARACLTLSLLVASRPASADAAPSDKAEAQRSLDEANRLLASGQVAAACAKFADSERSDATIGASLRLGECYVKLGKPASAMAALGRARALAERANDPRATKIREHQGELEQQVSNLIIAVAENEPAGLEVREDGVLVDKSSLNAPIPIDPGEHKITATAPGTKPREVAVVIPDRPQVFTIHLLPVEYTPEERAAPSPIPAPAGAKNEPTPEPASGFARRQRTYALVAGGAGLVGVGLGSAFGLMAKSTYDDSSSHCHANHCDATGRDQRDSAIGKATVSDVAFGVGGAALIGAAVLWFTAPRHSAEDPALITPLVGPQAAFVSLQRSF